jgi:hypothetical protein
LETDVRGFLFLWLLSDLDIYGKTGFNKYHQKTNPGNRDRLISWINHFIYSSSNIQFLWIPGQTGLLGNENADAEAKKAAAQDRVDDATLEFRDIKRIVSEFEFNARKNSWGNVKDNKMKEHKILLSKDRTYLTGNRAEDVFISRIRTGHTSLTHGYLMRPLPEQVQPLCESCGRMLTINIYTCRMHHIR